MSDLRIADDPVTLFLLGALVLLVGLPGILMVAWRVTSPPFQVGSFRWIYLAWACLLGSTSVWNLSRDIRFSAEEAGADNFVRLAFLGLGALLILFVSAKYRFALVSELTSGVLGIFFVFALWGLASTMWSVSPAGTFYKASEYCAMLVLFALAASLIRLAFRDQRKQLLALKGVFDWNWFLISLSLVAVYAGILIWPEYAMKQNMGMLGFSISGAFPGISSNGVGQLGAILGTVALVRILLKAGSKAVYIPVLMVSLVTVMLAQTRTAMLAFLLAVIVVLVLSRRFGLLALLSTLAGAVLLSSYAQTIYEFLRRGQTEGSIETLSSRTIWWEESLQAVRENWLSGYGANAGGRYVLQSALGDEVATVHNTYVQALIDTGAVGLVLLLVGLGLTWFWLFRLRSFTVGNATVRLLWFESLGILTVLSVRSIFSTPFVWSSTVLTFGLILMFITVMRRQGVRKRYASTSSTQPVPATWRRRPSIHR